MNRPAFLAVILACLSCGAGDSGTTQPRNWEPAPHTTAHFSFTYTSLDKATIAQTGAALEAQHARVVADLGGESPPTVRVWLYSNHDELVRALEPLIGPVPSWAMGAAPRRDQIHIMSPNDPSRGPYASNLITLVHEFAHCVSLQRNGTIGNNPRWFWEAVAVYEAGQQVNPKSLGYMTALAPPTFASMNSLDNNRIYELGYTIGEFVVERYGKPKLAALISSNANVSTTLGVSQTQFEQEWFAFVRQRYGF